MKDKSRQGERRSVLVENDNSEQRSQSPSVLSKRAHKSSVLSSTSPRNSLLPDLWHDLYVLGMPIVVIAAAFVLSVYVSHSLPIPKTENVSPSEFSEGRALKYFHNLSSYARPLNLPENMVAKAFIVSSINSIKQFYEDTHPDANIFMTTSILSNPTTWMGEDLALDGSVKPQYIAETHGIAVRLSHYLNSENRNAILISANYDTPALSNGAGDNAISVSTLLEIIQNILFDESISLNTDIIFLFSNGDNGFSAGINSFFQGHAWGSHISMFISLWGGGVGGKAQMFQYYNSKILMTYAEAVPRPWTNVITSSYLTTGLLPQHSKIDKSLFNNLPGIIFGHYVDRSIAGTTNDNSSLVESGSIQHLGDNIKALISAFSRIEDLSSWLISQSSDDSFVYFDILGIFCIYYSGFASIWIAVGVLIAALIYTFLRIKAPPSSLWNLEVGTVDIKILLTCTGLVLLTIIASFLPLLLLSTIYSLIQNKVSTHYSTQILTSSFWVWSSVLVIHILIQDKFPVVFRAGIARWSHHLNISCLLILCVCIVIVYPLNAQTIQSVTIWISTTLLQLLFDHLIRYIRSKSLIINSNSSPSPSIISSPVIITQNVTSSSSLTTPLLVQQEDSSTKSMKSNQPFQPNSEDEIDEENEEEGEGEEDEEYYNLTKPNILVNQNDNNNNNNNNVGSNDKEFVKPVYDPSRRISAKSFETFNPANKKKKRSRKSLPKVYVAETAESVNENPQTQFASPQNPKKISKITIYFLRFFKVTLCVFTPSLLHWELCMKFSESLIASPVAPRVWGLWTLLFVFPFILIFTPALQKIRRLLGVATFFFLVSIGLFVTIFFVTDFEPTRPNTVFLHHIQQEWCSPEKSDQSSFLYLQATDIEQIKDYANLRSLCEMTIVDGNERCKIKFTNQEDYLNLPQPAPWVHITKISDSKTDPYASLYGVTVQAGSTIFALDFIASSEPYVTWYGPCSPSDNTTSFCDGNSTFTDGYPFNLTTQNSAVFLYPAHEHGQRYYFEMSVCLKESGPPISLMSFYGQPEVSPIVQSLLSEIPSWVAIKANFLGNAHLQGFWYIADHYAPRKP